MKPIVREPFIILCMQGNGESVGAVTSDGLSALHVRARVHSDLFKKLIFYRYLQEVLTTVVTRTKVQCYE